MKEISKNISPIDEMSDIWKPLTYEERIYLRENTKYLEFKKNEYIYRDGEMPEYMYFLLDGHVKIYKEGVCGRQQLLRIICPNNLFGYRAYFSNSKYIATAVGIGASLLSDYVPDKQMDAKIEECIDKKLNKTDEEENEDEEEL